MIRHLPYNKAPRLLINLTYKKVINKWRTSVIKFVKLLIGLYDTFSQARGPHHKPCQSPVSRRSLGDVEGGDGVTTTRSHPAQVSPEVHVSGMQYDVKPY